eukprot:TRINITY_DN8175_c0_g2_i8.p1 TRINITY_DN8175_c0_g2~~TRINITY_DN8175_c0_g2_i8.p1  ORF type:complete len:1223 (-),score=226.22 TRINITY_DN8175_c0_g2_i8:75-3743(-)
MIRRPPRSTLSSSSAASDVYKRQVQAIASGQSSSSICMLDRHYYSHDTFCRSGLWGVAKAVNVERGQTMRCVLLEGAFVGTAASDTGCSEMVMHSSVQTQSPQLRRVPINQTVSAVELGFGSRGTVSTLSAKPQHVQLGVSLQVRAVGLNFRDVLNVLGMYPGDPGPPGADCAGVGCYSAHRTPVLGLAFGSMRSYATTDPRLLTAMPTHWSYEEASSMPTVWVTVWTCLEELTGVRPGSVVLIQAATGGVGLVAVQCAQRADACVCATAGRVEKQAYLQRLGVAMLSTTRDSSMFAADLHSLVGSQRGLGTVLNSLSHEEYIPCAVEMLNEGGRFVEIGKRGIYARTQMAQWEFAVYRIVAMDTQCELDPGWQLDGLRGLTARSLSEVSPLPVHVYDLRQEGVEAFRRLHRANHIGKVVLSVREMTAWQKQAGGDFIITGGTGGLGLMVGCWVNTSQVVLLSRSGMTSSSGDVHWRRLTGGSGAGVTVELCDVGLARDVCVGVRGDANTMGIGHSAGVLADALLLNQTQAGLQCVWQPKASAAWNLHRATLDLEDELQMFVVFSSVAALLGNVGQANYAAANACLDGLTRLRRGQGLAGTSVQWGAWAGVGMAVDSGVLSQMGVHGMGAVTEESGLCALQLTLMVGNAVAGMAPIQWNTFVRRLGGLVPAFLGAVTVRCLESGGVQGAVNGQTEFVAGLVGQEPEAQVRALESLILREIHTAAGVSIDPRAALMESGMDSLAAIELQNSLQRVLGSSIKLPSTMIFDHRTAAAIAAFLGDQVAQLGSLSTIHQPSLPLQMALACGLADGAPTIGVVGMACLAGDVHCNQLWDLLLAKNSRITDTPPDRWAQTCQAAVASPRLLTGVFMDDLGAEGLTGLQPGPFSKDTPLDLHISTLIRVMGEAMSQTTDSPQAPATGAFTALAPADLVAETPAFYLSRIVASAIHADGPHSNTDAACSGGYLALASAFAALMAGDCQRAAVGGVFLMLKADTLVAMCSHGIVSKSGCMAPLSATADGMICGEACAAVVLDRDPAPERSRIKLLSAVTVPNGSSSPLGWADSDSMGHAASLALSRANVAPHDVGMLLLHAMGNPMSDGPEVDGVLPVLTTNRTSPLLLLSHKANLGHSVAASGILALIVATLAASHRTVPVAMNVPKLCKGLRGRDQVHLPTHEPAVLPGGDLLISVNGTSISGDNAHLVLQHTDAGEVSCDSASQALWRS